MSGAAAPLGAVLAHGSGIDDVAVLAVIVVVLLVVWLRSRRSTGDRQEVQADDERD